MKIQEMFQDERPREKALKNGVEALSLTELLAIIIRNGQKGYNALEISRELVTACDGSLEKLMGLTLHEIQAVKGIGRLKALDIKVVLELGRRLLEESHCKLASSSIKGAADVFRIVDPLLRFASSEVCYALLLDSRNKVIDRMEVSVGGFSSTSPEVKKICNMAVRIKATGVILVHNHPSGLPEPSVQDIAYTERLRDALRLVDVELLDHLVYAPGSYYSFHEERTTEVN